MAFTNCLSLAYSGESLFFDSVEKEVSQARSFASALLSQHTRAQAMKEQKPMTSVEAFFH